ncbi:MAG: hypothetical protein WD356_08170 [Pseudomonadales bacterium]
MDEGDDAESQVTDKEITAKQGDYKIVGALPNKNLKSLLKEVVERTLADNWNFERDILGLLEQHFPN